MARITEQPSRHRHLEKKSVEELTMLINSEDSFVHTAIQAELPAINKLITAIVQKLKTGGRLFYVGAGSGGRLAVLDAIEIPTTYGVADVIIPILAGGVEHLIEAREEMEDDLQDGWNQLTLKNVSQNDFVLGISASGTTPFVLAALTKCTKNHITTGCIVSNPASPIAAASQFVVEIITGPEFITGSTRMKCGTAQKMLFDMISTTVMIQLGRIEDSSMIDVKLINNKITDRAVKMLMQKTGLTEYEEAKALLIKHGSVREAMKVSGEKVKGER